jgi:hypothetical protein
MNVTKQNWRVQIMTNTKDQCAECGHPEDRHFLDDKGQITPQPICVDCAESGDIQAAYHAYRPAVEEGRSTVISEPGAAIRVERYNLTDEEREGLSINVRCAECGRTI